MSAPHSNKSSQVKKSSERVNTRTTCRTIAHIYVYASPLHRRHCCYSLNARPLSWQNPSGTCLLFGLHVCCVVCCVDCFCACCVAWCDGLMPWCLPCCFQCRHGFLGVWFWRWVRVVHVIICKCVVQRGVASKPCTVDKCPHYSTTRDPRSSPGDGTPRSICFPIPG